MWKVKIEVMLKEGILDPQGSAVENALHTMGYNHVSQLRVGKSISFRINEQLSREQVEKQVDEICDRLLANPVIEDYSYSLSCSEEES